MYFCEIKGERDDKSYSFMDHIHGTGLFPGKE